MSYLILYKLYIIFYNHIIIDIYFIGDQIIVTKKFYFEFNFKIQKSVLCRNEIDFFSRISY